jgi:hypothetical protein
MRIHNTAKNNYRYYVQEYGTAKGDVPDPANQLITDLSDRIRKNTGSRLQMFRAAHLKFEKTTDRQLQLTVGSLAGVFSVLGCTSS